MSSRNKPRRTRISLIVAAAAGLLIGTTALGYAQSSTQEHAPGQRMQERGSVPGHPGASDYAPGQRMHERGSKAGAPGALRRKRVAYDD
jgi:hypothetical protein